MKTASLFPNGRIHSRLGRVAAHLGASVALLLSAVEIGAANAPITAEGTARDAYTKALNDAQRAFATNQSVDRLTARDTLLTYLNDFPFGTDCPDFYRRYLPVVARAGAEAIETDLSMLGNCRNSVVRHLALAELEARQLARELALARREATNGGPVNLENLRQKVNALLAKHAGMDGPTDPVRDYLDLVGLVAPQSVSQEALAFALHPNRKVADFAVAQLKLGESVEFLPITFADAQKKAEGEHKHLLVAFFTPGNEHWHQLEQTTWRNRALIATIAAGAIAVKIEIEKAGELAKRYRIQQPVEILLLEAGGALIERLRGDVNAIRVRNAFFDGTNKLAQARAAVLEEVRVAPQRPLRTIAALEELAREFQERMRDGEALREYQAAYDVMLKHANGNDGVCDRLANNLVELGNHYAPALRAARDRRDRARARAEANSAHTAAAMEFAVLNYHLNEAGASRDFCEKLSSDDPRRRVIESLMGPDLPFLSVPFAEAMRRAETESKLVIAYLVPERWRYTKTYIGTAESVWNDPEIVAFLANKAVALRVDVRKNRELAKHYGAGKFPEFLFLRSDGSVIERVNVLRYTEIKAFELRSELGDLFAGRTSLTKARDAVMAARTRPADVKPANVEAHLKAHFRLATSLFETGQFEESLREFLWIYDAIPSYPSPASQLGLGTGYLPVERDEVGRQIMQLFHDYPPATAALRERRDAGRARAGASPRDRRAFEEFVSLSNLLKDGEALLDFYRRLPPADPRRKELREPVVRFFRSKFQYDEALALFPMAEFWAEFEGLASAGGSERAKRNAIAQLAQGPAWALSQVGIAAGSGQVKEAQEIVQRVYTLGGIRIDESTIRVPLEHAGLSHLLSWAPPTRHVFD